MGVRLELGGNIMLHHISSDTPRHQYRGLPWAWAPGYDSQPQIRGDAGM